VHQIHDTVVWRYHGYYLALYQYQHDPEFQDVELAMSRDGERFTFVCPGEKVIPFGPRGCWDASAITPSVPVVAGDRLMLYYGGTGAQPKQLDRTGRNLRETETRVAIGMATLRRDGFTHVEPQDELRRGVMTTIPVYPGRARTLCVNAECGSGASVQVEILEAGRGKVVTGYDRRSCRAIRGDNLDGPVRWAATGLLPHCTEPFQVRFYLNGAHARLFSFSFRE
jgi:hypothetical protein